MQPVSFFCVFVCTSESAVGEQPAPCALTLPHTNKQPNLQTNSVARRSGGKVYELPGVTHRGAFVAFDVLRSAIAAAA